MALHHRLFLLRHQRLVRTSLALATATTTITSTLTSSSSFHSSRTLAEPNKRTENKNINDEKKAVPEKFDITKRWEKASKDGREFLDNIIFTNKSPDNKRSTIEEEKRGPEANQLSPSDKREEKEGFLEKIAKTAFFGANDESKRKETSPDTSSSSSSSSSLQENDIFSMATDFVKLSVSDKKTKEKMIQDLIDRARESTGKGDFEETVSFGQILSELQAVAKSLDTSFGHLDLSHLSPTSLFYYLEHEDERKNPSWKRRMHRFHSGIDIKKVSYLNEMLKLSHASYANSVQEIVDAYKTAEEPLELVYCELEGRPNKPAHFIALKKDQSIWSTELEVVMVVRGTKTVTDYMTDCVVDAVPYRGGKAHSGILESGKWLVEEHKGLMEHLRKLAKKRSIKIKLVGHSLGAGAAVIAGMEFKDMTNMSVSEVVGFGCPSLLSPKLAKGVESYVTTVISDSDIVPRMSAATVANILLDMMEYDWTPHAKRDIAHALGEIRKAVPYILTETTTESILSVVDNLLETYIKPSIKAPTTERATPELCPPGMCVHLYKDGSGISGSISPGTFFQEIDITRRMVDDHYISSGYQAHLLELMRQYTKDHYFRFDDKTQRLVKESEEEYNSVQDN